MIKLCRICKIEFNVPKHDFQRRQCCSRKCSNVWKSNLTKNRPKSEEHKRKIGLAHKGKKRPPFSKEWRDNLSKARKGKKFTPEHCKRIGDAQRGEKSPRWRGGKSIRKYVYIRCPFHPKANSSGYIREHTFVMEKHLGRFLLPKETIHHINGIQNDNRIENLQLFENQSQHAKLHNLINK